MTQNLQHISWHEMYVKYSSTRKCYPNSSLTQKRQFPVSHKKLMKSKGNVISVYDMMAYTRRKAIAPLTLNRLKPNDPYMGRTAPLTSKRCILYIYSTNIGTEYFKHAVYSPFFSSSKCSLFHNANLFGSCIIHILYTECAKI